MLLLLRKLDSGAGFIRSLSLADNLWLSPPSTACAREEKCPASNTYYDWLIDHVYLLVPAQAFVGEFLQTFREYPQRQKAASFNLDEVLQKIQEGHSA